jgi:hypothetical protein
MASPDDYFKLKYLTLKLLARLSPKPWLCIMALANKAFFENPERRRV